MSKVGLRPVQEPDLPTLRRLLTDPDAAGTFQWFGFRVAQANALERRWAEDGLLGGDESYLVVVLEEGTLAGWVNWRPRGQSCSAEIGIVLFPEHRGHGIGTEAQRQVVAYLLTHTTFHRLEARTETDNFAEQRALEKVGFRREGVTRDSHFRGGAWRDSIWYGLLRDDLADPPTPAPRP